MDDKTEFTGGVFSSEIDDGRAGAEVTLAERGVRARTTNGQEFLLPYNDCRLEIGGASGRMVFCRNQDRSLTIFCEERGFPDALGRVSAGLLAEQVDDLLSRSRRDRWRGRSLTVVVLLVLVGLLVGGYYGIVAGARAAVRAVPMSVDAAIGDAAFEAMEIEGPEVKEPVIVGAVQTMVDRLAQGVEADGVEFRVTVIDAPVVNAFALPGGRIVVYTGLLDKAAEPEQVAGVLGHEMAHVTMRHGMERIAQSLGLVAAIEFLLGDVHGLAAIGAEVLQVATINSYSRDQEAAADAEGVRTLHAAGLDPLSLARFFEVLKKEHGDLPGAVSWISTHPQHDARITAIRSQLKELPPQEYRPFEIDWQAVQQRVRGKLALPQLEEQHDGR